MSRLLRGLAIAMLLVTIAGAAAVLYGLSTMQPEVVQAVAAATPATQAQKTFDSLLHQLDDGTFAGTQLSDADGLSAQACTFLTFTVRLKNRGFFPAEWISLSVEPKQDGSGRDVLQMGGDGARVLPAGGVGDLSATVLRTGSADDTARRLTLTCYVFGRRIDFDAQTE